MCGVMGGSRQTLTWALAHRIRGPALWLALGALALLGCVDASHAQEPPLGVPIGGTLPPRPGQAIPIGGWLLYPTVSQYTKYSDNVFNSPVVPISAWAFGIRPSLTAEWSNGIHTTDLYGNFDSAVYPTHNELNTFDWNTGFTQKYEALRDLIFRLNGDIVHKTITNGLQNSIPTPINAPQTVVLPNGDILLPNGLILSPNGQVVGHQNPLIAIKGTTFVNPYDQFTGTFSIDKIFNPGILNLTSSVARTNYEKQSSIQDSTLRTVGEHAGVWLGPLFYAYSDGSIATTSFASGSSTAHRIVGGIGTGQFGLFTGRVYYGHQGTEGSGAAGGEVYGGGLSYYPTPAWTLGLGIDETVNVASEPSTLPLALTLPGPVPVQVPIGASTRITTTSLTSGYRLTPQWSTSANFGYTRIEYVDSSRLDNDWSAGLTLSYDMWRNLALSWQYEYTAVSSNAPGNSSKQNLATMSANYRF